MELFQGAAHSGLYAKYRWAPPDCVIAAVVNFLKSKLPGAPWALGIDVGCGSGQSSPRLAPYFTRVSGYDVSQGQIDQAISRNTCQNVEYSLAPCSALPAPSGAAQLVAAFQACHWFDMPAFYEEADRVLCRGGVIALVSYRVPRCVNPGCGPEVTRVLRELYLDPATGLRWNFDRTVLEDCLTAPQFTMPYPETARETQHTYSMETSLEEFMGYISTWSAYQDYVRRCGEEAGKELLLQSRERLLTALGGNSSLCLEFPYFVVMGRKP